MKHQLAVLLAAASAAVAADDIKPSLRAEINADALTRTSLLGDRQDGGAVRIGGLAQIRYTANIRDAEGAEESFTHGFAIQYAQLTFDADLNETWSVHVQGNFSRSTGAFGLDDAWADWELDENWTLRAGQFKSPFSRERLTSDKRLLAADRSTVNAVFALNRTQGVMGMYDSDDWRAWVSFNDGASDQNSDFNGAADADYSFTGRAEWRFAGDWSQLNDFAGWQGQSNAGSVGAGAHYQNGGNTGVGNVGATADMSLIALTGDVAYEGAGWSVFGALHWQLVDPAMGDSMSDFGALVQGGYFISDSDELFGRYDVVIPDGDTPGGDDLFNTITVGWNHYFILESHASKFTLDLTFFLDATTENGLVSPNNSLGLLESDNGGQFAFRAQYSAAF